MPIYEYHCGKCGDFEIMQKISDEPLTTCPTCRRKVTKLISSTTFHLKGSGWYITDYARKGEGGGSKAEKAGDKKADASGAGDGTTAAGETPKDSPGKSATKKADKKSVKAVA
jgi:putative FmdB family regulatory protein